MDWMSILSSPLWFYIGAYGLGGILSRMFVVKVFEVQADEPATPGFLLLCTLLWPLMIGWIIAYVIYSVFNDDGDDNGPDSLA